MNTTAIPPSPLNGGRAAARLQTYVRSQIVSGAFQDGQYLPTERELAEQFNVARMTARRALKSLEAEGLIVTVPRHGYRVLTVAQNNPTRDCPIAYVLDEPACLTDTDDFHKSLFAAFQHAASRRASSVLAAYGGPMRPTRTMEQLHAARVWGVAIDSVNADLIKLVCDNNLPALMVDAWREDATIDTVVQDDYQGGLLAATHLLSLGHRRIAWAGPPPEESSHSMARYGGAAAGLARAGLTFSPGQPCLAGGVKGAGQARELLTSKDPPTAFLALWREPCRNVMQAAQELSLVSGKDLDVVGWSTEEQYESTYRPMFPAGQVPPAIVWSVTAMAELAVTRLAERRADPALLVAKINVPVRLRTGQSRNT